MLKPAIIFLFSLILLFILSLVLLTRFYPKPQTVPKPVALPVQNIPAPTETPSIKHAVTAKDTKYPARQISEHQWTMDIEPDNTMATPEEIFNALNTYRQGQGKNPLVWNNKLANFAQARASLFTQLHKIDDHDGFYNFIYQQNGFTKVGFYKLGENSSYAYKLSGVNLIEKVFAGDKPHDDNQLDPIWKSVGIGVDGNNTDIVFGGYPIG